MDKTKKYDQFKFNNQNRPDTPHVQKKGSTCFSSMAMRFFMSQLMRQVHIKIQIKFKARLLMVALVKDQYTLRGQDNLTKSSSKKDEC